MAITGKWLALSAALLINSSLAATVSPGDRDVIQNQQQQRLEQNQQQRDALWQAISPQSTPAVAAPDAGRCFAVRHIVIRNATLLSARQQQALIAPYIQRCLTLSEINALVHAISDWYMQRGYITSRAFLTEQDLSEGRLVIPVLEGKLESIRLEGEQPRLLTMTFPSVIGRILNLRDIEQGMEQINRLRSTPVQIQIEPATRPGYSVVNLTATPQFSLSATVGFDNSGQKSTGVGQLSGSLTGNNLLGFADPDRWFISGGRSSAFCTWRDAQNVQAGVSVPLKM